MAEGFLKKMDPRLEVYSAGTNPSAHVHPKAVRVMAEVGVDLSCSHPKDAARYLRMPFDYVITVCDNARETCPVFLGKVKKKLHIGFDDPAEATGSEEEILAVFRRVRDEIQQKFTEFYQKYINEEENGDVTH